MICQRGGGCGGRDHPLPCPKTQAPRRAVGLGAAPSGSPSPLAASLPEPARRLLHPCQLINRLSSQVSDIDHLIRTLSDQSLAHLMGLLPRAISALLFCAREQVAAEASALPTWHPTTKSPLASPEKVRVNPGLTHHLPSWSCQLGSPACHLQFCPCLVHPGPGPPALWVPLLVLHLGVRFLHPLLASRSLACSH